jgi:hypothetical protein
VPCVPVPFRRLKRVVLADAVSLSLSATFCTSLLSGWLSNVQALSAPAIHLPLAQASDNAHMAVCTPSWRAVHSGWW